MNASTVPVTITPEAAARVAELGMQAELEQMIEHLRQTIPQLRDIQAVLVSREPTDEGESINLVATMTLAYHPDQMLSWELAGWEVRSFPPEVCEHILMWVEYENGHAG